MGEPVTEDKKKARKLLRMTSMLGWVIPFIGLAAGRKDPSRQMQKCALPGCDIFHDHPGGYCCKDHCMLHKQNQYARLTDGRKSASDR